MYAEHFPETMTCISVQITLVTVLCTLVKVVVLRDQLFKLRLNIDHLIGREFELNNGHFRSLEVGKEPTFLREEEKKGATTSICSSCGATHSVDVACGLGRGIKLNDPIDGRNVEPSCSNVSTYENTLFGVHKLEERIGSSILFHFPVQMEHREVNITHQLRIIVDTAATRQEHDDFLLEIPFEKAK